VPFLRFSRDKRGYEHFYLIEPTTRRGKSRNRILYWFRTPPGIKVGRLPFDDQMKRTLEARYPDVAFDWQTLIDTPIPAPPPDVERWRERRRLERVAKQAAASDAAAETTAAADEAEGASAASEEEGTLAAIAPSAAEPTPGAQPDDPGSLPARRRRRRGGRRGRVASEAVEGLGEPLPASDGTALPEAAEEAESDDE
jgi:hypothetical protein